MKANATTKNGGCGSESRTAVSRAIDWLQSFVDEDPYTDAAKEARSIINELGAVRNRPALDELLALIAQIAKTDRGFHEINKAKIQISQRSQRTHATDVLNYEKLYTSSDNSRRDNLKPITFGIPSEQ